MEKKSYAERYGENGYIDFSKLWDLMRSRGVNKEYLKKHGIHSNTVQKLKKNESVTCAVIANLCNLLDVQIQDICEYKKDTEEI